MTDLDWEAIKEQRRIAKINSRIVCAQPGEPGYDGRTKSDAKDDCDINIIMKRYMRGIEPPVSKRLMEYGDFTGVNTFQEAAEIIQQGYNAFDHQPVRIRNRFNNDLNQLLEFLQDPENHEEARQLGLLEPLPRIPDNNDVPTPPSGETTTPATTEE